MNLEMNHLTIKALESRDDGNETRGFLELHDGNLGSVGVFEGDDREDLIIDRIGIGIGIGLLLLVNGNYPSPYYYCHFSHTYQSYPNNLAYLNCAISPFMESSSATQFHTLNS